MTPIMSVLKVSKRSLLMEFRMGFGSEFRRNFTFFQVLVKLLEANRISLFKGNRCFEKSYKIDP